MLVAMLGVWLVVPVGLLCFILFEYRKISAIIPYIELVWVITICKCVDNNVNKSGKCDFYSRLLFMS